MFYSEHKLNHRTRGLSISLLFHVACAIGAVMIGLAVLSSKTKNLAQLNSTLSPVAFGPSFGIFLLGMLNPWCSAIGAWMAILVSYVRN